MSLLEFANICELFSEDVPFFPAVKETELVDALINQEMIDTLQSNQTAYPKKFADLIEEKVMLLHPFDYQEVKRSYHRIAQTQLTEQGIDHKAILEEFNLPCPF